jgi:hypothetical protein
LARVQEENDLPTGSKVEEVYQALLKKGHSEESAARIAQSQTGEALATGRPPKHENKKGFDPETAYGDAAGVENAFQNGIARGRKSLESRIANGMWGE